MPDVPVTLTPWFDAKDNPPNSGRTVRTDVGDMWFGSMDTWDEKVDPLLEAEPTEYVGWLEPDGTGYQQPARMNPSVWCDPSPPDMNDPLGPLTVKVLRRLVDFIEPWARFGEGYRRPDAIQARGDLDCLRRALDAIDK